MAYHQLWSVLSIINEEKNTEKWDLHAILHVALSKTDPSTTAVEFVFVILTKNEQTYLVTCTHLVQKLLSYEQIDCEVINKIS